MPFTPTQQQFAMLRALEYLEVQGCPSTSAKGKPGPPKIIFGRGVPEVMLKAWILVDGDAYRTAIEPLLRRRLVRRRPSKVWVSLWRKHRFVKPDGSFVELETRREDPERCLRSVLKASGVRFKTSKKRTKRSKGTTKSTLTKRNKKSEVAQWSLVEARITARVSREVRTVNFSSLHSRDYGSFISVTTKGLDLLDALGADFVPDALVRLSQVAPLTGLTKRTLERYLADGKLPAPEVRGGKGRAHKWYWLMIRPALERLGIRNLPPRFPGSHIA